MKDIHKQSKLGEILYPDENGIVLLDKTMISGEFGIGSTFTFSDGENQIKVSQISGNRFLIRDVIKNQ